MRAQSAGATTSADLPSSVTLLMILTLPPDSRTTLMPGCSASNAAFTASKGPVRLPAQKTVIPAPLPLDSCDFTQEFPGGSQM